MKKKKKLVEVLNQLKKLELIGETNRGTRSFKKPKKSIRN